MASPTPPPPTPAVPQKKSAPPRRPSTSVPTIRRSETTETARPKREIHPPPPKDLPYAEAPKKMRSVRKAKVDDGTEEQLKFCSKLLNDLHKKSVANIASHFYFPVGAFTTVFLSFSSLSRGYYHRSYCDEYSAVCQDNKEAHGLIYHEEEVGE